MLFLSLKFLVFLYINTKLLHSKRFISNYFQRYLYYDETTESNTIWKSISQASYLFSDTRNYFSGEIR